MSSRSFLPYLFMLSAVGCSNDSAPPDAIVPECCLETEEHLTIGEEYDSPHAFIFGDPAFIVTDAHGNIVIGDKLRMDIRVFDASGKLLRENAVRGAGPGEFYDFTSAGATDNGRLVVSDQINARVTGLSPDLREEYSLGLDPNEVLWPRAMFPLEDKFLLLFRLPPESEGDGCLIHLYDADFRSRVECIAYAGELLNTDEEFHEIESGIGVVRGVVTDAEGNPLPMISMTVVNTEVGAATHLDGSFLIHSVPAGRQTLRFSGRGAGPAEVEVTVPASDTAEVAIEMPSGR